MSQRHPLHPAFVHLPIGLWAAGTGIDCLSAFVPMQAWWQVASLSALWVANATGLLAMLAGMVDRARQEWSPSAEKVFRRHLLCSCLAWLGFLISALLRSVPSPSPMPVWLGLEATSLAFLGLAGFFGGELVYQHAIGLRNRGQ